MACTPFPLASAQMLAYQRGFRDHLLKPLFIHLLFIWDGIETQGLSKHELWH